MIEKFSLPKYWRSLGIDARKEFISSMRKEGIKPNYLRKMIHEDDIPVKHHEKFLRIIPPEAFNIFKKELPEEAA